MSAYRYGEKKSLATSSCGSVTPKVFNSFRLRHRSGCSHQRWAQVSTGHRSSCPGSRSLPSPWDGPGSRLQTPLKPPKAPKDQLQMQSCSSDYFASAAGPFSATTGVFIAGEFVQLKEAASCWGQTRRAGSGCTHSFAKAGRQSSKRAESWQSQAGSSSPKFIFLTQ